MAPARFVVALIRHGDYEQPAGVPSAHLPHPLTAKGREQATKLAATLIDEGRAHRLHLDPTIDCSTLLRAWQTASLIAEQLSATSGRQFAIAQCESLCERSVGAAANLTVDQIAAAVAADPRLAPLPPSWKSHPRHRLPFLGAESLMQAGARVAAHLESRAAAHAGAETLVMAVSHGGALRHAAVTMGALEIDRAAGLSMAHCGYVLLERLPGGGWSHLGGQWKVRK